MTTYDPALIERLVAEAREDDAKMVRAPWTWTDGVLLWNEDADHCVLNHAGVLWDVSDEYKVGIVRIRNNLSALANQLEAALCEVKRVRRVGDLAFDAARVQHVAEVDALRESVHVLTATTRADQLRVELACEERDKLEKERDELRAEVEKMRPVVDAAEYYVDAGGAAEVSDAACDLQAAVSGYRTKEGS